MDLDKLCEACNRVADKSKGDKWCQECRELCLSCEIEHRTNKLKLNHQIQESTPLPNKQVPVSFFNDNEFLIRDDGEESVRCLSRTEPGELVLGDENKNKIGEVLRFYNASTTEGDYINDCLVDNDGSIFVLFYDSGAVQQLRSEGLLLNDDVLDDNSKGSMQMCFNED
ncbi:unnamed protein product [Mytilus coruscus]|uniref:B box-type domain-containing protein n=1 Tax=Mytilus coruscus TaxID=42192 RepID=A0A6J8EA64_MYTCO|nr:unnamed protein product [Mytilus coruscus]